MSQPLRALIVEDSEDDALLLVDELRRGGFEPVFERVDSPEAMSATLAKQSWDIIFADYTMPHFRGTMALELLKKSGVGAPFIFVSGTIGEDTAVSAMKAGAHDYVMKGNLKRLLPAVERELREAEIRRQRKYAEEEVRRQQGRIRALHEIDVAIISTLELRAILELLLAKIDLFLSHSPASTVRLFDRESGALELTACRNLDEKEWRSEKWEAGRDLDRVVVEIKTPLLVDNLQSDPRTRDPGFFQRHGLISYLGVPLIAKGEVLGVLSFYTKETQKFSDEEVEFLNALTGPAAIAIHNSQLFQQTKKQAVELERLNRVKSEFFGVMSHELRTPLNVITGYTRLVQGKMLGEINQSQEQALRKSLRYCNDLLTMINDILETSRIEAEPAKVQSHEVHVGHFLDELKSAYDVPLDKEITFIWDCPGEFPIMKTDSRRLRHVLQNLINNAIKFTEKGSIKVSACYIPEAKRVKFKVADTGIGIPKEKIPVIFEMFRQVDSSDARSAGGVGLGLYIVKKFTEMVEGRIGVESDPGKGTTFTVTLPLEISSKPVETDQGLLARSIIRDAPQSRQREKALKQQAAELSQKAKQISALHSVAAAVSQSLDLDVILSKSLEKLVETLVVEGARIFILDESSGELRLRAQRGVSGALAQVEPYHIGEGLTGKVFETGEVMIFENIQDNPEFRKLARKGLALETQFHAAALFPIRAKEKILGVIHLFGYAPHRFIPEEIELVASMANQMGVAIENAKLFAEVCSRTAELVRSNKVKDQFLSVMSHELRTPLNVVIGYTAMIQDKMLGEVNEGQEEALGKVLRQSRDLLSTITSILHTTAFEAEEVRLVSNKVHLSDFLDRLRAAYEVSMGKELTLAWDYPSDLPVVETDSEKLRHILLNLINNAIKFTEKGRVAVSARIKEASRQQAMERAGGNRQQATARDLTDASSRPPHASVEFKVVDTGIGISKEALPFIFEKFHQADSSETRRYGGVGLGLYVTKKFAEMLGGKIDVESEPGKGSTFTVTIPCET